MPCALQSSFLVNKKTRIDLIHCIQSYFIIVQCHDGLL
jgi:hypothetical protein